MKLSTYIILILITTLLFSCKLNNDDVKSRTWKYGEGYWMNRDLISLGGVLKLRNDTIYFLDSAAAVITDTHKNYLFYDNEIEITSLKTREKGTYHDFGPLDPRDTVYTIEIKAVDLVAPPIPPEPK